MSERPTDALRKMAADHGWVLDDVANALDAEIAHHLATLREAGKQIAAKDRRIAELEALFPLMGCGSRATPGTQHWIWLEDRAMCRARDIGWSDMEDANKDWSCVFSTQEMCENARKEPPHA